MWFHESYTAWQFPVIHLEYHIPENVSSSASTSENCLSSPIIFPCLSALRQVLIKFSRMTGLRMLHYFLELKKKSYAYEYARGRKSGCVLCLYLWSPFSLSLSQRVLLHKCWQYRKCTWCFTPDLFVMCGIPCRGPSLYTELVALIMPSLLLSFVQLGFSSRNDAKPAVGPPLHWSA